MTENGTLLAGKKIVETSAGSIGTVIVRELLRQGRRCRGVGQRRRRSRSDPRRGRDRRPPPHHPPGVDITSEAAVHAAAAAAIADLGCVDALVCTAAVLDFSPVATMSLDQWRRTIDVNLTGVFLCNRAFVTHMTQRKRGSIINISSVGGAARPPRDRPLLRQQGRG